MREKRHRTKQAALQAAMKLRQDAADRMVRSCTDCPATSPSKRRPPRWATIARALAARFDLPAGEVREALAAELAAERGRYDRPRTHENPPAPGWEQRVSA